MHLYSWIIIIVQICSNNKNKNCPILPLHLVIPMRCTKSQATAAIYSRLSLTLVRSSARALLSRAGPSLVIIGWQYFCFSFVVSCNYYCIVQYEPLKKKNQNNNIIIIIKRDLQQVRLPELPSRENDAKCKELGWICVPMMVEAYGAWGQKQCGVIFSSDLSPCN